MAAQPIPPVADFNLNVTITIDNTLTPTPQGCVASAPAGQQIAFTFTNNSGSPISVTFTPNTLFSDMASLSGSQTQYVQGGTNASVNYVINGNNNQPYAIQVGIGPMVVTLGQATDGSTTYTPDPVAIPLGNNNAQTGTLQISAVPGNGYNVAWKNNSDPFKPPITSSGGQAHALFGASAQDYPYSANLAAPKDINVHTLGGGGGGTVKVRPS
ncbi:MAG TPA: hypothetical protein VMT67_10315 [Terriglobales bacterium]|nr:hypothetical protein [Terriglobales bacterium]